MVNLRQHYGYKLSIYGHFRYDTDTVCIAISILYDSEYSYMVIYWINTVTIIDVLRSTIKFRHVPSLGETWRLIFRKF